VAGDPILEFAEVDAEGTAQYAGGLRGVSLSLRPGELAAVRPAGPGRLPPLADLALGLLPPARGRVTFAGEDWTAMSPDRAVACRGRIGRVFAGAAWIGNLDVDENVILRERHLTRRPEAEVRREAQGWAARFGLAELPATRPAWTPAPDLIRAQWVRALLGRPALLLLEDAEHEAPAESLAAWRAALAEAVAGGAAALWIGAEPREWPPSLAGRIRRWAIRGAALQPLEESQA